MTIRLLSTWVSLPKELDRSNGEVVLSGIRKERVIAPMVEVSAINIEGDGQADLRAHGGPDKAVYVYPADHLPWWRDAMAHVPLGGYTAFGENLSVSGVVETDVCIGDRWQWGDVVLEVAQPRWPCFKLMLHSKRPTMVADFVDAARSGWYMRVIETGSAPTSGPIAVIHRDPERITVRDAFTARRNRATDPDAFTRICAHPKLAVAWK